jgi:DtxR family Mn-dependent transcriptional regulator
MEDLMEPGQLSATCQDYLKAVYRLQEGEPYVSPSRLAEHLEVSPASVTAMLKRLSAAGFLDYRPREGAALTAKGVQAALEVIRHHRLLELFFVKHLGMTWDQAHWEAEVLEHFISEELERVLDERLGHPEFDPQGAPIPAPDGSLPDLRWPKLSDVQVGKRYRVRQVRAPTPELSAYVASLGLVPGAALRLAEMAPFEGPVTVELADGVLHLGRAVASAVRVEELQDEGSTDSSLEAPS